MQTENPPAAKPHRPATQAEDPLSTEPGQQTRRRGRQAADGDTRAQHTAAGSAHSQKTWASQQFQAPGSAHSKKTWASRQYLAAGQSPAAGPAQETWTSQQYQASDLSHSEQTQASHFSPNQDLTTIYHPEHLMGASANLAPQQPVPCTLLPYAVWPDAAAGLDGWPPPTQTPAEAAGAGHANLRPAAPAHHYQAAEAFTFAVCPTQQPYVYPYPAGFAPYGLQGATHFQAPAANVAPPPAAAASALPAEPTEDWDACEGFFQQRQAFWEKQQPNTAGP